MPNIYEIIEKYLTVLENIQIDDETGEILNAETLEIADAEFNEKSEAYGLYIKNLKALAKRDFQSPSLPTNTKRN